MENDCVVFGCRNSSTSLQLRTKKNDCNFFHFPLGQQELTEKWLKKICLEGWFPGPENVVCEEHFSLDSFVILDSKRVLKQNAIPNLVDELDRVIINIRNQASNDESGDKEDESNGENEGLRCRICAKYLTQKNAISIYSDDENVLEKMMACIPILVKTNDTLPKQICHVCLIDLNISYRMLIRAIESEKLFNSLLHKLKDKSDSEEIFIREEKQVKNNSDQRTICAICDIYFDDANDFDEHFQQKHIHELDFNDRSNIRNVEKVKASEAIVDHNHKPVGDENPKKLSTNDRYDSNELRCLCLTCDMAISSREVLASHIENFHKIRMLKPEDEGNIPIIINDTTASELVQCQLCDLTFESGDVLNEHMDTHIETMMCDVCGFMCEDYQKMLNHREVHTKEKCKNIICDVCFTAFSSRIEMMQHKKKVHQAKSDAIPQKWICKYCGKETSKKLSLMIHERVHTGARPFVCESCGRSFKSKANLIQHQTIHTGEKRYKCSVCDKAFARKSFVHTHMRVHTGERPFRCDICGKRYTQVGDMRRHRKCHIRKEEESSDKSDIIIENGEKCTSIFETKNSKIQSDNDDNDGKFISTNKNTKQINDGGLTSLEKPIDESKLLPNMPSLCEEEIDSEKILPLDVFQNNGLIKLHFAKDVTDFRRILVELQQ